ncbi:helix-turn-helix transcriptional regulator [Clostridium sp. LP20]|uniref:helix-turn-helix transcriptional regulator n=1 Tax=Clostridium sp. LP20 TaxID=3418665 RepID=UPI003EE768F0
MKIDRLISIIMTLNNKGRVNAKELANRYEVSIKTIQRDIEAIDRAGIPIVSFKGQDGGYEIMDNYKINNTVMNKGDIYLIATLLEGLGKSYDSQEINSLKEKFEVVNGKRYDDKNIRLIVDFSAWGNGDKTRNKLSIIDRALKESKRLEFYYNNLNGESSHRTVEIIKLIFKGFNWYVYAYCLKKESGRLFKVRRMNNLIIKDKYNEDRNINLDDLFSNREDNIIEIKLKCTNEFCEKIDDYFDDYKIIKDKEKNIVEVSLPEDQWLYSMLLGLGDEVEVMEPLVLRELIKNKIYKMYSIYK